LSLSVLAVLAVLEWSDRARQLMGQVETTQYLQHLQRLLVEAVRLEMV
jgi:hypothetical protein